MLEIRVIGELEVRLGGVTAELPASRRSRALLGWLAIHPGRHSRARLAGLFWPDVLDASARASLRSAMWALRAALGPELGGYLAGDRDTITLAGDGLRVDLREARRLLAERQPAAAVALCGGELLQDLDDEWVLAARDELDRDLAPFYCPECDLNYCSGDWNTSVIFDEDFYDYTEGTCPSGHRHKVDD